MNDTILQNTIKAFNQRNFAMAIRYAGEGLEQAQGRDEAFWMGICETCEGYALLDKQNYDNAEVKLVAAMQKLRSFGFRYNNFEVTAALAGIRRAVEEIRAVRMNPKKVFDVSLLPQLRLAAKADD